MKVLITAAAGLKFMEQERLYKAILHHQSILIKTKFITIAFHLQWPREKPSTCFVTLPSHLSPFVGCLFQFELTFIWLVQDLPQFPCL
jgi:hypothetical protein